AIRNIVFGVLYKAQSIILPFFIRTVMIYIMGSQYVGLGSLFTSVLRFLSLAELGIGHALVFSMYAPIAKDDDVTLCALLNLYRKIYRCIGTVILVVGLALMPFLKYLISDGYPADINIYVLYSIYLSNTVISYLMFGYKQSLLVAFQRSDIISKRTMAIQVVQNIVQFSVLLLTRNYYLYVIFLPVFTAVTNIFNLVIVNKMYPQYKCSGNISKELKRSIIKKVTALIGTKANTIVLHAADNVVISAFLGLITVGIYGNYYHIMNSVVGVITTIYSSLTAGLGNSLETDNVEKNYNNFNILSFINFWLVTFCSVCLLCLYQPFMDLWVGKELMFGFDVVVLLTVYFFVYQIRRIVLTYKDAGGVWWEDRFRPYVMMFFNLTFNIILVQVIGIQGVILSTIISMLISLPWENYTVFKFIFKKSSLEYYLQFLKYVISAIAISAITYFACYWIPYGWIGLFIRAGICVILPNVLLFLIFFKSNEFRQSMKIVKDRLKGKLGRKA
ncbi:MAG: polysaccharide biosynthesis protein, partial [Clostridia bacterium]|nr:polysaccharide biosynthesis protein [Clostridia bacterium]